MRMSRLYMPAVTFAGALALAGCGGGSGTPGPDGLSAADRLAAQIKTCTDAGNYWDGSKCVDKPEDTSAADAKKAASAVYSALINTGATATLAYGNDNTYTNFKEAEGDKDHQMITVQGSQFKELAGASGSFGPGAAAANGVPGGHYTIANASGADGSANELDRDEATSAEFGSGLTAKTHNVGSVSGSWMGVAGTFYCVNACTSHSGHPQGPNWRFVPTSTDSRVTGRDARWGWWAVTDNDDETTHFLAFADQGGLETTAAPLTAVDGSATYAGKATGKYAVSGEAGDFTATASLTAKFDADGTDTLSGKVDGFKDADGKDKTGWSVELKENNLDGNNATLAAYSDGDDNQERTTVWTIDGVKGTALEEAWAADLYGGTAAKVPTHALGAWEAQHQGAHMIGAFGAPKTGEVAE